MNVKSTADFLRKDSGLKMDDGGRVLLVGYMGIVL